MSSVRRILVAGLPAAGATVLAALALGGAPALAAGGSTHPAVMATPDGGYGTPAPVTTRGHGGYGGTSNGGTTNGGTTNGGTTNGGSSNGGSSNGGTAPVTAPTTIAPTHTRGHGGYGGVSPSTVPTSPVPTGNTDTVPPGGVSPSSATPTVSGTTPGGVSAGHAPLPLTGAPTNAIVSVGVLLVALGGVSVWYTRRRRSS